MSLRGVWGATGGVAAELCCAPAAPLLPDLRLAVVVVVGRVLLRLHVLLVGRMI